MCESGYHERELARLRSRGEAGYHAAKLQQSDGVQLSKAQVKRAIRADHLRAHPGTDFGGCIMP